MGTSQVSIPDAPGINFEKLVAACCLFIAIAAGNQLHFTVLFVGHMGEEVATSAPVLTDTSTNAKEVARVLRSKDYFELLGLPRPTLHSRTTTTHLKKHSAPPPVVPPNAPPQQSSQEISVEVVRKQYKTIARLIHPDKCTAPRVS